MPSSDLNTMRVGEVESFLNPFTKSSGIITKFKAIIPSSTSLNWRLKSVTERILSFPESENTYDIFYSEFRTWIVLAEIDQSGGFSLTIYDSITGEVLGKSLNSYSALPIPLKTFNQFSLSFREVITAYNFGTQNSYLGVSVIFVSGVEGEVVAIHGDSVSGVQFSTFNIQLSATESVNVAAVRDIFIFQQRLGLLVDKMPGTGTNRVSPDAPRVLLSKVFDLRNFRLDTTDPEDALDIVPLPPSPETFLLTEAAPFFISISTTKGLRIIKAYSDEQTPLQRGSEFTFLADNVECLPVRPVNFQSFFLYPTVQGLRYTPSVANLSFPFQPAGSVLPTVKNHPLDVVSLSSVREGILLLLRDGSVKLMGQPILSTEQNSPLFPLYTWFDELDDDEYNTFLYKAITERGEFALISHRGFFHVVGVTESKTDILAEGKEEVNLESVLTRISDTEFNLLDFPASEFANCSKIIVLFNDIWYFATVSSVDLFTLNNGTIPGSVDGTTVNYLPWQGGALGSFIPTYNSERWFWCTTCVLPNGDTYRGVLYGETDEEFNFGTLLPPGYEGNISTVDSAFYLFVYSAEVDYEGDAVAQRRPTMRLIEIMLSRGAPLHISPTEKVYQTRREGGAANAARRERENQDEYVIETPLRATDPEGVIHLSLKRELQNSKDIFLNRVLFV